jgi:hypothetical protein
MAEETSNSNSIEAPKNRTTSRVFAFNDASSSDVVVRLSNGAPGDAKDSDSESSVDLFLHRTILVENSFFFSAPLSERWASTCSQDASGRPVLVIKHCTNPEDFAIALQKLYEKAPGDPKKCPVHSFSSFEDALRCLKPADQLCLSSVLDSATDYIESIPWTCEQAERLSEVLAQVPAAQKLLDRTQPASERVRTALLNQILLGATSRDPPHVCKGARSFMREVMQDNLSCMWKGDVASAFATCIRRSLSRLQERLENLQFEEKYSITYYRKGSRSSGSYELDAGLSELVDNLAWIFNLPQLPGEADVRRDVAEVMALLQVRCEPEPYKTRIFHVYIAEALYAPVIAAVAEGSLVINAELRTKLLKMWVPSNYAVCKLPHLAGVEAAFSAVLSTLGSEVQEDILHDWVTDLMNADPWEPWFKEWMAKHLVEGSKVRSRSHV